MAIFFLVSVLPKWEWARQLVQPVFYIAAHFICATSNLSPKVKLWLGCLMTLLKWVHFQVATE